MARHPIQPTEIDERGVVRFKQNRIVNYLLDHGGIDMNALALLDFSQEDREQFAQLIGYSLDGFGTLSYASDETLAAAEAIAATSKSQLEAENEYLRQTLQSVRSGMRDAVAELYGIHPDDLDTP